MSATGLQCKECGTSLPARGAVRLRAVLRPARGRLRLQRPRRRRGEAQDPGGTATRSGATPTSSRSTSRPADTLQPGLTPLVRADRLAERLGVGEVWIKNDAANPTHSLQGPRRRASRSRRRSRARLRDRRLRLDRQPRQRGRRPRRRRRARLLRLRPGRPRGAEAARDRRLRHRAGRRRRQLRRRQPALHRARAGARLGLRQRQPAPVLRRGLEDARLRDRRAARLASCRTGSSRRSPRARCSRRSAAASTEWIDLGLVEGELPSFHGAQATGCNPVAQAFADGHDICQPVKPDTIAKSLAIGNPADGPYALELARKHRRLGRRGHRRRDPRRHQAARRRRPGSSPRPPAASRRRRWRSSPSAASSTADERVVVYITGEGLKTLDAVRDGFEMHEIEPSLDSFVEVVEGANAVTA